MPLAEFLRLMAQSHITLIHGNVENCWKDSGILSLVVWFLAFVFLGFFFWWWGDTNDTERMCVGLR